MKTPLYILRPTEIQRKQNSIYVDGYGQYQNKDEKWEPYTSPGLEAIKEGREQHPLYEEEHWWAGEPTYIPVERLGAIFAYAPIRINSALLGFLAEKDIPFFQFGYQGNLQGVFQSKLNQRSKAIFVSQANLLSDENSSYRLRLAQEIIHTAWHNIHQTVNYYHRRGDLSDSPKLTLDDLLDQVKTANNSLQTLFLREARVRKLWYQIMDLLLNTTFQLKRRDFNPPTNPTNAMISYLNAILYATITRELHQTQLDPQIGILHTTHSTGFPLSYDISEIFKPLFVDRLILSMVRKKQIKLEDFERNSNTCLLNANGRYKVIRAFEAKMRTTIQHPNLNYNTSYRYLIRLECYKLIKHLQNMKEYEAFRIWW